MAGSLNHIVDSEAGHFDMDLIENLGDAHEALEECFDVILYATGGSLKRVNAILGRLGYPSIEHHMHADPCHAEKDGDCAWAHCPQRHRHEGHCRLDLLAKLKEAADDR